MASVPKTGLKLGTRGSPLALAQAHLVKNAIVKKHGLNEGDVVIIPVKTTGDKVQDRPLAEIGGKALWTKELDRALTDGEIDCAVHSMKDVETIRPAEVSLAANLPRADYRDRLIGAADIAALPEGGRIGTSSPRRAAQLMNLRPDLSIASLRGNVATRLKAIETGDYDATLLAAAGLDRLGMGGTGAPISPDTMLPAAQQGAIGIEIRTGDGDVRALVGAIGDRETAQCIAAERALLRAIGGDCHSPIAALAELTGDGIVIRAEILSHDGCEKVSGRRDGPADRYREMADELAADLLDQASPSLRGLFAG